MGAAEPRRSGSHQEAVAQLNKLVKGYAIRLTRQFPPPQHNDKHVIVESKFDIICRATEAFNKFEGFVRKSLVGLAQGRAGPLDIDAPVPDPILTELMANMKEKAGAFCEAYIMVLTTLVVACCVGVCGIIADIVVLPPP